MKWNTFSVKSQTHSTAAIRHANKIQENFTLLSQHTHIHTYHWVTVLNLSLQDMYIQMWDKYNYKKQNIITWKYHRRSCDLYYMKIFMVATTGGGKKISSFCSRFRVIVVYLWNLFFFHSRVVVGGGGGQWNKKKKQRKYMNFYVVFGKISLLLPSLNIISMERKVRKMFFFNYFLVSVAISHLCMHLFPSLFYLHCNEPPPGNSNNTKEKKTRKRRA